jgi:hypothetical protein
VYAIQSFHCWHDYCSWLLRKFDLNKNEDLLKMYSWTMLMSGNKMAEMLGRAVTRLFSKTAAEEEPKEEKRTENFVEDANMH